MASSGSALPIYLGWIKANLLMPNSIELLVEGLVKGQVKLKVLDLRANAFKDDGGCLIASLALEGCFDTWKNCTWSRAK